MKKETQVPKAWLDELYRKNLALIYCAPWEFGKSAGELAKHINECIEIEVINPPWEKVK